MLPKFCSLLTITSLLGSTALAAPAAEVPAALSPRQTACPTTTRPQAWAFSTVWLATTTLTNGWSSLGSVTSTKTESQTRTITTWATVISPDVSTLPGTTTTTYTAIVTTTNTYELFYETTTLPSYAPSSECILTTVTHILPTTRTIIYTQPLSYATTWSSTTGHVTTTTEVAFVTTTRTTTKPGATVYATTVTEPRVWTVEEITSATITSTVWAGGCREWGCLL